MTQRILGRLPRCVAATSLMFCGLSCWVQANAQPSAPSMPSSPPRRWAKLPVWAVMTFEQHQECATLGLDDIISHYVGHPEHAFSLQQLHALLDDAQLVPHAARDVEALLLAHAQEGHSDFFAVTRRDFARLLARVAQKISLADKVLCTH